MRLSEVFRRRDALAPLLASACATDDAATFVAGVQAMPPNALLAQVVRASANDFAEMAAIAPPIMSDDGPIAFAGQQPYVDYYPAVPVKLDALASCGGVSFFGFADYAQAGSDPWMTRTELPSVAAADGVLRLSFLRSLRAQQGRDLRFVPPPDAALLALIAEMLKGLITDAARHATFAKNDAYRHLRELLADHEVARIRAGSLGAFNAIVSARVFDRLGFTLPFVSLSELLSREELLPSIAETLAIFIRERTLVSEAVHEARALDEDGELHFTRKEPDHVPLAIAGADGIRRTMRVVMRGDDHLLVAGDETFNAGSADTASLVELLGQLHGRWSLDVFAPLFLFRLGASGIVNGRGSIRYSLVLGHVLQRVFGERHVPNLLCSTAPEPSGPLIEAVRHARGELPPALREYERTLIDRLLTSDVATIREEIRVAWR